MSIGENPSSRQPVERGVGEQRDNEIANDVKKARGIKMAKKDDRPIDAGLAALIGKSEQELIDFWKQRFGLISAIPMDTARVGALTPQLRELVRIENREERKRLTAARMKAFVQLPGDVQQQMMKTREAAYNIDRGVLEEDQRMVDELLPTIPEAKAYQDRHPTAAR
ncbi:MAG: hypothetical protein AABM40_11580 [Chloroflexota bacterium]